MGLHDLLTKTQVNSIDIRVKNIELTQENEMKKKKRKEK